MRRARAYAKINLALLVGPTRDDGLHEVATVLLAVDLHDELELRPSDQLSIDGYSGDTLVRRALTELASKARVEPQWGVTIEKQIPVAAGLGGGSSDAASALRLANATLDRPLPEVELHGIAARLGADVPFFLHGGCQLATGVGSDLHALDLDRDFHVVLVLPADVVKGSTADVYAEFDLRRGSESFADRKRALLELHARRDLLSNLATLPRNDLVASPLSDRLRELGAFRADVSGAGPTVYALFARADDAARAADAVGGEGRTWLCRPVARW